MPKIDFALKEVTLKIVYYGPGLAGKTTNMEILWEKWPPDKRGELTSLATEGDRTLCLDLTLQKPPELPGFNVVLKLVSAVGAVYYNATRKVALEGADGVIFIVDSRREKLLENIDSFTNLEENLREAHGVELKTLPHVIQYNKRDLPDAAPLVELDREINRYGAPAVEAIANTGEGVRPTLKKLYPRVLEDLTRNLAPAGKGAPAAANPAAAPAPTATRPPEPAELQIVDGRRAGEFVRLDPPTGRLRIAGSAADIVVPELKGEFAIFSEDAAFAMEDPGGAGAEVNGRTIQGRSTLRLGDEVRLECVRLRLVKARDRAERAPLVRILLDGKEICRFSEGDIGFRQVSVPLGRELSFVAGDEVHRHDLAGVASEGETSLHLSFRCPDGVRALEAHTPHVQFQPFLLPGFDDPRRLARRGLGHRLSLFPGLIDFRERYSCICDRCKKGFRLRHLTTSEHAQVYCDGGPHLLVAGRYADPDAPIGPAAPDPAALTRFEARLPSCERCGGRFRYKNPLRCPHCKEPFIDYDAETRAAEPSAYTIDEERAQWLPQPKPKPEPEPEPEPQPGPAAKDGDLYAAVEQGDTAAVRRLIETGANVHERRAAPGRAVEWTPIFVAAERGHLEVARALIDAGADAGECLLWEEGGGYALWRCGLMPLDLAIERRHDALAALLVRHSGAPYENGGCRPFDPFERAAELGLEATVTALIEKAVESGAGAHGVLKWAVANGRSDVVLRVARGETVRHCHKQLAGWIADGKIDGDRLFASVDLADPGPWMLLAAAADRRDAIERLLAADLTKCKDALPLLIERRHERAAELVARATADPTLPRRTVGGPREHESFWWATSRSVFERPRPEKQSFVRWRIRGAGDELEEFTLSTWSSIDDYEGPCLRHAVTKSGRTATRVRSLSLGEFRSEFRQALQRAGADPSIAPWTAEDEGAIELVVHRNGEDALRARFGLSRKAVLDRLRELARSAPHWKDPHPPKKVLEPTPWVRVIDDWGDFEPIRDVRSLAWAPDGKHALCAEYGTAMWREVPGGRLIRAILYMESEGPVAVAPDGRRALIAGQHAVQLADLDTGKPLGQVDLIGCKAVAFLSDERHALLAVGGLRDPGLRVATLPRFATRRTFGSRAPLEPAWERVWMLDGDRVAAFDGRVLGMWDLATGKAIFSLEKCRNAAVSPRGDLAAMGGEVASDAALKVIEVPSGRALRTLESSEFVRVPTFSPDGTLLAGGDSDGGLSLWDVATGKRVSRTALATDVNGNSVRTVAFSPDGASLLVGTWNSILHFAVQRATS